MFYFKYNAYFSTLTLIIAYYKTIFHRVLSDKLCNEVGNFESRYIYETHDEYVVLHLVSQNNGITFIPDKFYMSRPYNNLKATHATIVFFNVEKVNNQISTKKIYYHKHIVAFNL